MTAANTVSTSAPELVAKAFLRPANRGQPSTPDQLPNGTRFWIDTTLGRVAQVERGLVAQPPVFVAR
jgi:hypothetical protein